MFCKPTIFSCCNIHTIEEEVVLNFGFVWSFDLVLLSFIAQEWIWREIRSALGVGYFKFQCNHNNIMRATSCLLCIMMDLWFFLSLGWLFPCSFCLCVTLLACSLRFALLSLARFATCTCYLRACYLLACCCHYYLSLCHIPTGHHIIIPYRIFILVLVRVLYYHLNK